jgi:hypothetical protein
MQGDVHVVLEEKEQTLNIQVTLPEVVSPGSESACTHQGSADNTNESDRLICSATILQHHL